MADSLSVVFLFGSFLFEAFFSEAFFFDAFVLIGFFSGVFFFDGFLFFWVAIFVSFPDDSLPEEQGAAGFRDLFIVIRAMPAAVAAAKTFFEMVFFGQDQVSIFVIVEVVAFNPIRFHVVFVLCRLLLMVFAFHWCSHFVVFTFSVVAVPGDCGLCCL